MFRTNGIRILVTFVTLPRRRDPPSGDRRVGHGSAASAMPRAGRCCHMPTMAPAKATTPTQLENWAPVDSDHAQSVGRPQLLLPCNPEP